MQKSSVLSKHLNSSMLKGYNEIFLPSDTKNKPPAPALNSYFLLFSWVSVSNSKYYFYMSLFSMEVMVLFLREIL